MKRIYHALLSLAVLLIFITGTLAQDRKSVTGTVMTDEGPAMGVNVTIKGTVRGTITDINGNFSIQAIAGDTVLFS